MEEDNWRDFPYKKTTEYLGWIVFFILVELSHEEWFPAWALYTVYAFCIAVPVSRTVYAYIHHRKKSAIINLLFSVIMILLIVFRFTYKKLLF